MYSWFFFLLFFHIMTTMEYRRLSQFELEGYFEWYANWRTERSLLKSGLKQTDSQVLCQIIEGLFEHIRPPTQTIDILKLDEMLSLGDEMIRAGNRLKSLGD